MFKGEIYIGTHMVDFEAPDASKSTYNTLVAQMVSSWTQGEHMLEKSPEDIFGFMAKKHAILVFDGTQLVGHGALTEEYSGKILEIGSIIVSPSHRHEGIGTAVTYALLALAKHEGYGSWTVFALANPTSAKMFEKMGAYPMSTESLGPEPWILCSGCKFLPTQTEGKVFVCCDTPYHLNPLMDKADAYIHYVEKESKNPIPAEYGHRGMEAGGW